MRIAISICIFCISLPALFGQTAEDEMLRLKQKTVSAVEEVTVEDLDESEKKRQGTWNFSVGTSYSYMKGYGSGMSFFAAPTYTMPVSDKWSLHGGMVAMQYAGLGGMTTGESFFPNSFSSIAIFAAASYRMNDRLVLHGTGVKQLISAPVTPFTPYPMDDFSLGATYKLGNNITIGASVHMNNGMGHYVSPMNGYMFQPPLGW